MNDSMKRYLKIAIVIAVPLIVWLLPETTFSTHIAGFTIIHQRLVAIFVFAMLSWLLEPIPVFATSICIIFLQLLTVTKGGFIWLSKAKIVADDGTTSLEYIEGLLEYKEIFKQFGHPVIMLFVGGFFLALAAKKYELDRNLARVLLKPFGTNPKMVLLGMIAITAIFSMFMSNTATTAMMLAILMPVLDAFEEDDRGRIAFVLAVPFAANIGGIGTPIGTPPNAIAMKYFTGDSAISFAQWMAFAIPYVIATLIPIWLLLVWFYPSKSKEMILKISGKFPRSTKANIVYVTTAATVLLWMFGSKIGINSYVAAMLPVTVFLCTDVVNAKDIKTLSWDVLWLMAGGFALGYALQESGLSEIIVHAMPFDKMSGLVLIAVATVFITFLCTFMSHTATANMILPIMAALATSLGPEILGSFGGGKTLLIAATFACSLGMALPVSTPPNAMAYATGLVNIRDMAKVGSIIALIGFATLALMLWIMSLCGMLPVEAM